MDGALWYLIVGGLLLGVTMASTALQRLCEIALIVSLFTAGLKLRTPFRWKNSGPRHR